MTMLEFKELIKNGESSTVEFNRDDVENKVICGTRELNEAGSDLIATGHGLAIRLWKERRK